MILLTGGTGFAGRHLVQQFVADGRVVRILSRSPAPASPAGAVSYAQGDLTDPQSLRSALAGVRTVVHAAAVVSSERASEALLDRVNAGGTGSLARMAREMGVRRFIHIGSAGVYGDGATATPHRETDAPGAGNAYERSKLSAERALASALEGSPVEWTILRATGLYGPERPATVATFREVVRKRIWIHGPARVLVHPTHIADLVQAVGLVVDRDGLHGEVINIGGARYVEHRELIALIGTSVGHTPLQLQAPGWTSGAARLASQAWGVFANPPARLARLSRACINRAVSIEKARRLLGFEPVALEWGLERTAAQLREQGLI